MEPDQATIDAVRRLLERAAAEEDAALPHQELTASLIRHLRVAIDRAALLDWLPHQALVAEIGVGAGDFTAEILAHAAPQTLHLIDSWAHDERFLDMQDAVATRFAAEIDAGQVVVDQGYSLTVLAGFPDGYFDWVLGLGSEGWNFHFNPQVKLDVGKFWEAPKKFYMGVEIDWWLNKYQIPNSPFFDTNQQAISLMAKYHF